MYLIVRILLLFMFLFVSTKSSILVSNSISSNNSESSRRDLVKIIQKNSCDLIDDACCCSMITHINQDCRCKSSLLGKDSKDLVAGRSVHRFLDAVISSVKCSNNFPGDFHHGSLSDYEPLSLNIIFLCLFEESGFQSYLQEDHIGEPHIFLPYKPPETIS